MPTQVRHLIVPAQSKLTYKLLNAKQIDQQTQALNQPARKQADSSYQDELSFTNQSTCHNFFHDFIGTTVNTLDTCINKEA